MGAVIGTYQLDGMLEGPLDGDDDRRAKLKDWIRIAHTSGYSFSLQVEGDRFSLLADNTARQATGPDADMAEPLRSLLEQLVATFPPPLQLQLFSTVRSLQWSDGVETQTIYEVTTGGQVEARQRTVDAPTTRPTTPMTAKDKAKLAGIAVLALLAVFGLSSFFVDWGDHASKAWRQIGPLDTEAIATDLGAFEPFITVKGLEAKGSTLRITLERTDAFPLSVAEAERALEENGLSYAERAALHALAAGYARLEAFGAEAQHLATADVRLAGLRTAETVVVPVEIVRQRPPSLLRFTW